MTIAVGLGFCMALYALTVFVSLMVYFFPVAGKEEWREGERGAPVSRPRDYDGAFASGGAGAAASGLRPLVEIRTA